MKILIVEDNPHNCQLLEGLLAPYGSVKVAVNGKLGLTAYEEAHQQNEPFDLIFLDIVMPEMDGNELHSLIRKYEKDQGIHDEESQVKVVISTSKECANQMYASFSLGAFHYFLKPYHKEELDDLMDQMGYQPQVED